MADKVDANNVIAAITGACRLTKTCDLIPFVTFRAC